MNNLLLYFRLIAMIAIPYAIVDYFSASYYQLSLWEVIKWWALNLSTIDDVWAYLLGLFFVLLVYFLSISGLINLLLQSAVGVKKELVYLGHESESNAIYYRRDDLQRKPFTVYDIDQKYNYTFDRLYRAQSFIKDPGEMKADSLSAAWTKANRFHAKAWIAQIIGFFAFSMVTIIALNAFIHQAYVAGIMDTRDIAALSRYSSLPLKDPLLAFDTITASFSLTRGYYFSIMGGLILLWLGFTMAIPRNKLSKPLYSLPPYIIPEEMIRGTPVELKIKYVKMRRSSNPDRYETVDSGKRYVNFAFNRGFDHTVYVVTLIDVSTHGNQIEEIKKNIKHATAMDVLVEEDLSISLKADAGFQKN